MRANSELLLSEQRNEHGNIAKISIKNNLNTSKIKRFCNFGLFYGDIPLGRKHIAPHRIMVIDL